MNSERFPTLTEHGRQMLEWLREHPHAPTYTLQSGNRLTEEGLRQVRAFEAELRASPIGWPPGTWPSWLNDYVDMCFGDVPFYRRYGARPTNFLDIPTTFRGDLSAEPWSFVPDSLPLDKLVVHSTSGTTGHSIVVPSHPVVSSCYLPLLRVALERRGITLESGRGRVAIVLVGYQQKVFTYASVIPLLDDAGYIKIDLHPNHWRDPNDRARFLDSCNPEIYTGDPISFAELARLSLQTRPQALLSTSMTLLPGLRHTLEDRFGCPVLDIYSLNETGPVGVADDEGCAVMQHRLYAEILDADGTPCPPGVRGEVTLTGGFNTYLPLLRYRTGDYASLTFRGIQPVLVGLEGRPPTVFRRLDGQLINNIDVTHALKPFALPQFTLHQSADGSLRLRVRGAIADENRLRESLLALFGQNQRLTIQVTDTLGDKVIQYTSDMTLMS